MRESAEKCESDPFSHTTIFFLNRLQIGDTNRKENGEGGRECGCGEWGLKGVGMLPFEAEKKRKKCAIFGVVSHTKLFFF